MNKKRVLFLTPGLAGGGAEKALVTLINALDVNKYEVKLLVSSLISTRLKEMSRAISYEGISKSMIFGKKTRSNAPDFVASFCGDFVAHSLLLPSHDVKFLFRDSLLLTKFLTHNDDESVSVLRIATDYTVNGLAVWKDTINRTYLKMHTDCYNKIDYVLAGSKQAADSFSAATGVTENVITIKNIFDGNKIKQLASEETEVVKTRFTIGSVGRSHPDKGFDRFLDVCSQLNNEGFDFDVWLVGPEADDNALCDKINALQMSNVYLPGYQDNPYKYMQQFDLYVNPAFSEGSPNAPAEAVILGIPCVVTDHCGEREIFGDNNEYGLIVENTTDGLYNGLKTMISNKDVYEQYKQAVLVRQNVFDQEVILAQYEELFGQ